MAQGNTYICKVCGKEYQYCPKCKIVKPDYDAEMFCSNKHADIFKILSKHGCKLATAEETIAALDKYNLDSEKLSSSIRKHIEAVKAEAKPAITEEVKQNFQPINRDQKK